MPSSRSSRSDPGVPGVISFLGRDFVAGLASACDFLSALYWPQQTLPVPSWRNVLRLQVGGSLDLPGDSPGNEVLTLQPSNLKSIFDAVQVATLSPTDSSLLSPADRYASLAASPVGGCMFVARFRLSAAADSDWSAPVIRSSCRFIGSGETRAVTGGDAAT